MEKSRNEWLGYDRSFRSDYTGKSENVWGSDYDFGGGVAPYQQIKWREDGNDGWSGAYVPQYTYTPPKKSYDWGEKYSWAGSYTYKKPDYQKITAQLKKEQAKLSKLGIPIKISYGHRTISRKVSGLTRVSAESLAEFNKIRKLLDKTTSIGVKVLGKADEEIMKAYSFGRMFYDKRAGDEITPEALEKGMSSYDDYIEMRENVYFEEEKDGGDPGKHWGGFGGTDARTLNKDAIHKYCEEIRNKLKVQDVIKKKEESIRKGHRVNRRYVYETSRKPLVYNNPIIRKKKKVLNIVDASGSMSNYFEQKGLDGKIQSQLTAASEFMYGIEMTGIFECTSFFTMTKTITKSDIAKYEGWGTGGAEGFSELGNRLLDMGVDYRDFDYIFVFSDLNIGASDFDAIVEILNSGMAKNIMFNFADKYYSEKIKKTYPDLKVVNIQSTKDMISALVNYV